MKTQKLQEYEELKVLQSYLQGQLSDIHKRLTVIEKEESLDRFGYLYNLPNVIVSHYPHFLYDTVKNKIYMGTEDYDPNEVIVKTSEIYKFIASEVKEKLLDMGKIAIVEGSIKTLKHVTIGSEVKESEYVTVRLALL